MPNQDNGRRMERVGQVAAALWRKNEQQNKRKERREWKGTWKGKRKGKQRRDCTAEGLYLVTSAGSTNKANPNSEPLACFLPSL